MKKNNFNLKLLQKYLIKKDIDAFFISDINNVKYLSKFSGTTAYLIICKDKAFFFTDGRYEAQSKIEIDGVDFTTVIVTNYNSVIEKYLYNYKTILIEKSVEVYLYDLIMQSIDNSASVLIDVDDTLLNMRSIKNDEEIALIKEQYDIAGRAFIESIKSFKVGDSELTWAGILAYNMMKLGAVGESFDTIVASGYRGGMPHGVATDKIICDEPIIFDFGSRKQYNSDYTRMIYSGDDKEVLTVIDIIYTALRKAIDFVKVGVKANEIDRVARGYIESKGYGKYFNHSLGHGVGLNIHEFPTINSRNDTIIDNGMVFTIEPGIYLPEKFGVRLEDTVLISDDKVEVISSLLNQYCYQI